MFNTPSPTPAYLLELDDMSTYTAMEVFNEVNINGAAFSGVGCLVYFTNTVDDINFPSPGNNNHLWTWSLTSPGSDPVYVGEMLEIGASTGFNRADGLAFSNGDLYASDQDDGLYRIDEFLNAELVVPYSDEIVGGIASDSSSGIIYGLDDRNLEIIRFDLDAMSVVSVASYPTMGGSVVRDIDGLAAGGGKLYLITDEPGNFYIYDLARQQYVETIESPFTNGEVFSGAAYVTGSGLGEN